MAFVLESDVELGSVDTLRDKTPFFPVVGVLVTVALGEFISFVGGGILVNVDPRFRCGFGNVVAVGV